MVAVVAENSKVEKEVQNLLDILVNAGCGFHSQLVIHEKDGGLSIQTEQPMERDKEIIRLPRTVLMPGDQYALDVSGGNFVVNYPEQTIVTDLQRRIIDKMYEIYNLTNKVRLHEEYSFLLSLKDTPALIEKLGEVRDFIAGPYVDWVSWIKSGMTDEQRRKLICGTYVKTRPLGYSDPVRESSVSMIMPILDFMNHHWEGGIFAVGQGAIRRGDLTMQCSQPFEGSTECYANYGVMDALDSLVRYDFVDEASPVLRSVGITVEGPAGGEIQIQNKIGFMYNKELSADMQDLRRHIPDIAFKDNKLTVSHILLPADQSKFALVRVLNVILASYDKHYSRATTEADAKRWRQKTQEAIIEKNKEYYKGLSDFIEALPSEQKITFGVQRVKNLSLHQMEKLNKYKIQ